MSGGLGRQRMQALGEGARRRDVGKGSSILVETEELLELIVRVLAASTE